MSLTGITALDVADVVADVRHGDSVTELELLQRSENTALPGVEATTPLLLLPVRESGVPLETPFTIRDGDAEREVTAPHHRLSEPGSRLEAFGIPFTVNEVRRRVEPGRLLTDRQLSLVHEAVERGYLDTLFGVEPVFGVGTIEVLRSR